MDGELLALATTGATTLVGLMVTDGWEQARTRVAALLRRSGEGDADTALDQSRQELAAAGGAGEESVRGMIEAEWRDRLVTLLQEDPGFAAELQRTLDDLTPFGTRRTSHPAPVDVGGLTVLGPAPMHWGDGDQHNHFGA